MLSGEMDDLFGGVVFFMAFRGRRLAAFKSRRECLHGYLAFISFIIGIFIDN